MSKVEFKSKLDSYVVSLRRFRVWHRWLGSSLALLLVLSALTGVLLALKKDVAILQPPTQRGESKDLSEWQSLDQLAELAQRARVAAQPEQADNTIKRLDVRPTKGMVKVLFEQGFWEVQIDGQNGAILSIAKRHSDWIEALHDLSIVSDAFKLVSMNFLGWGLLVLSLTGLWLWYGARLVRKLKRRRSPGA